MFLVWIGSVLTSLLAIGMAAGQLNGAPASRRSPSGCGLPCCSLTSPKRWRKGAASAANSLKGEQAQRCEETGGTVSRCAVAAVAADTLRKGDVVLVEAGDIRRGERAPSKAPSPAKSHP